ncbi:MAG: SdiA-regulated domain-containing protein [Acidobacteriota bacterium]
MEGSREKECADACLCQIAGPESARSPLLRLPRFGPEGVGRWRSALTVALACLCLFSLTAQAQLKVEEPLRVDLRALGINDPQGVTYHPQRQTLFLVAKNPGRVFELTLSGGVVSSFDIPEIRKPEGIAYDSVTGDLLICRGSEIIFKVAPDGSLVDVYLSLSPPSAPDGIAIHPITGHIFVADDSNETVSEVDRTGRVLSSFSTSALVPGFSEPQGLAFYGTDLLITDDADASKTIYRVSTAGELIETLSTPEALGIGDPEGIANIGQDRTCLVADVDGSLLCFTSPREVLALPSRADFDDSFVAFAAVNLSDQPNSLNIEGYTASGRQQGFVQLETMPALGQTSHLTSDLSSTMEVASSSVFSAGGIDLASLVIRSQRGPFQGLFMVGDSQLARLDGVGGGLEAATLHYFLATPENTSESTTLFLFNPSSWKDAGVTLTLHDKAGGTVKEVSFALQPLASINTPLRSTFDAELPIHDGYLRVDSTLPVKGFELLVQDRNLAAIGGQQGSSSGTLVAPHFFIADQGATTTLRLLNLAQTPGSAQVTAFDDHRREIGTASLHLQAGELFVADLGELFGIRVENEDGIIQGYLEILHRGRSLGTLVERGRLAGLVTYQGSDGDTLSSLPMESKGRLQTLFPHVAHSQAAGVFQGLALLNSSQDPISVSVQVYERNGKLRREATFPMEALERVAGLLDDSRFFGAEFEQVGGSLQILSTGPVVVFSLFGGSHFLSAIEGQALAIVDG